jgi:DNA-binding GntR family transcriptional regulator
MAVSEGNVRSLGLRRTVLREEVKNVLLERILSAHYEPGERLVERFGKLLAGKSRD